MSGKYMLVFVIAALALSLAMPLASSANWRRGGATVTAGTPSLVGVIDDPVGDDKGYGNITYPTNNVFQPGVFDLVKFAVGENDTHIFLNVTMNNLGDNPWQGPNGFCLQYIHIYIYDPTVNMPVNYTTVGLNAWIYPGWNYAVLLAPGWGNQTVPEGQISAIYDSTGGLLASQADPTFEVTVASDNKTIVAIIDKNVFESTNVQDWVFAVAVTGYDGYGAYKVRSFSVTAAEWNFGGADPNAIVAGVFPYVVDILAPSAQDQYTYLSSYDANTGKLAVIPGVSIANGTLITPPEGWVPPGFQPNVTTTTTTTTSPTTTTQSTTTTTTTTGATTTGTGTSTQTSTGPSKTTGTGTGTITTGTATTGGGGGGSTALWVTVIVIIIIIIGVIAWWAAKKK